MPDTIEALGVVLLAVIPGALYTWALEREIGCWGIGLSDRVLRFVGASVVLVALSGYPLYYFYSQYLHEHVERGNTIVFVNRITDGQQLPWWIVLVPIAYVGVPLVLGTVGAVAVRRRDASKAWGLLARLLIGRDPAPRAWDKFFADRPGGVCRMQLKGTRAWVGGYFGDASYAAGYPEIPQDIFLEKAYLMNTDGPFETTTDGDYEETGSQLLIRWEEVEFLEFFPGKEVGADGN